MLGALGFTITGFVFIILAKLTFNLKIKNFNSRYYSVAYIFAAIAFFVWGLVVAFELTEILAVSVILGDALLLISSGLLLASFIKASYKNIALPAFGLVAVLFLLFRAIYITPSPFIDQSILIFNPDRIIAFILALVFFLFWFGANNALGKELVAINKLKKESWSTWYYANIISLIGFCGFILAQKPQTVAFSFIALSIGYMALTAFVGTATKEAK